MIRMCLSRSFNASFLSSLIAVGFSLFVTVHALPVLAADGDLDTSFGTGGKVVTAVGGGGDIGTSVAIQSDGKIVVAGHSQNGGYYDFALVRYAGTPPASTNAAPSVPIPALPTILLMVLSGLLALFGFFRVRASK